MQGPLHLPGKTREINIYVTERQKDAPAQMLLFFQTAQIIATASPQALLIDDTTHWIITVDKEIDNQFAADSVPVEVAYYIEGYNRPL